MSIPFSPRLPKLPRATTPADSCKTNEPVVMPTAGLVAACVTRSDGDSESALFRTLTKERRETLSALNLSVARAG